MAASDVSNRLKEACVDTLRSLLSAHQDVRKEAESQVQQLEVTEGFGTYLTEIAFDPRYTLPIRQLSLVLLKQYVDCHWWKYCEDKFHPPEVTAEAKAVIREVLPRILADENNKIRCGVAHVISTIAHWDWPEEWPTLFSTLMIYLQGTPEGLHGSMTVLLEVTRNVDDKQMPQVIPVIIPEIYRIFTESGKYNVRTRSQAVQIFTNLTEVVCVAGEYNKGLVKTLLGPFLLPFTEALVKELREPDGPTSDVGLKTAIIKALTVLVKNVPKQLSQWLLQILPTVWNTLTISAHVYVATVVNETEEIEQEVELDGEVISFGNLVSSIFEFVHALVETPRFRSAVKEGSSQVIYYIILFMQITEEQVSTWTTSPYRFVEDESEDSYSYSVRLSAQDLLVALRQEFEDETCAGLCDAVTRHLQEAEMAHTSGASVHWWKAVEASLLSLGVVKDLLVSHQKENQLPLNVVAILQSSLDQHNRMAASPFLLGRCLWAASKFASCLPEVLLTRYLQATVEALQPHQDIILRIIAVRSVWGFCDHLKTSRNTSVLIPMLPMITDALLNLAVMFTDEVLSLLLETLTVVLAVDKQFTASCEAKVIPMTIALFLKHNADPVIMEQAQDIFRELSQNEACLGPLQHRLVPTLISIMQSAIDKVPSGLHGVALDVVETLVRASQPPLSDSLMQTFPSAIQLALTSDDPTIVQNGGECLRAFVSVCPDQVAAYRDSEGHSGLYFIIQVALNLLSPTVNESCSAFVGRLVSTLFNRAGAHLGESVDLILRAVLSKLQGSHSLVAAQSLIMVYAHLVHSQMDAVLNFLSSVPGPKGQSALHFVLNQWCSRQHVFTGAYENKVGSIALAKLLHHGITSNDTRLTEVTIAVEDESVVAAEGDGIRTRSQRGATHYRFKEISILVKILKLLIYELSNCLESTMAFGDVDEEEDEDEDGGNNEGMRDGAAGYYLSNQLDEEDQFDDGKVHDPDAQHDPLASINLQQYLTDFLRSFSSQPYFLSGFLPHINSQEKQVLTSIGIQL